MYSSIYLVNFTFTSILFNVTASQLVWSENPSYIATLFFKLHYWVSRPSSRYVSLSAVLYYLRLIRICGHRNAVDQDAI